MTDPEGLGGGTRSASGVMSTVATRRLTRDERRRQLLDTAFEIVRSEGSDALTLVRLAERAGVSRPIAYEHFATREGLLLAMYQDYDEQLVRTIREAIDAGAATLEDVAATVSGAYIDGVVSAGAECDEINAALMGNETTRAFRQRSRDLYVEELGRAFAPFVTLAGDADVALLTGVLGALEALGQAAATERTAQATAIAAATRTIVATLGSHTQVG
jgi:AcrR family transcriptional regulator